MEFIIVVLIGAAVLVVLVLAAIPALLAVIRVVRRWAADRSSPQLEAEARVVDKRSQITGGGETPADQRYFVTFQFPDGGRLELAVPGTEAGVLIVGDEGRLGWQGTRYLSFAREILR